MYFRPCYARDGSLIGVERLGAWEDEIDIAIDLLEFADPAFLKHGDGLVTFRCLDETATYGLIGGNESTAHARVLTVRPTRTEREGEHV